MFIWIFCLGLVGFVLALAPRPVKTAYRFWREGRWLTIYCTLRTWLLFKELLEMLVVFLYVYIAMPLLIYSSFRFGRGVIWISGALLVVLIATTTRYMLFERRNYFDRIFIKSKNSDAEKSYRVTALIGGVLFVMLAFAGW